MPSSSIVKKKKKELQKAKNEYRSAKMAFDTGKRIYRSKLGAKKGAIKTLAYDVHGLSQPQFTGYVKKELTDKGRRTWISDLQTVLTKGRINASKISPISQKELKKLKNKEKMKKQEYKEVKKMMGGGGGSFGSQLNIGSGELIKLALYVGGAVIVIWILSLLL